MQHSVLSTERRPTCRTILPCVTNWMNKEDTKTGMPCLNAAAMSLWMNCTGTSLWQQWQWTAKTQHANWMKELQKPNSTLQSNSQIAWYDIVHSRLVRQDSIHTSRTQDWCTKTKKIPANSRFCSLFVLDNFWDFWAHNEIYCTPLVCRCQNQCHTQATAWKKQTLGNQSTLIPIAVPCGCLVKKLIQRTFFGV